jgi:hypothetical protein
VRGLDERLLGLMRMIRGVQIDTRRQTDVAYAVELFQYLAGLYRVFAEVFYPEPGDFVREKAVLAEMAAFASAVSKVEIEDCIDLLTEFVAMAKAFGARCTRKNNIALNKEVVHRVLKIAQSADHPGLRKRAMDVAKFLKGR